MVQTQAISFKEGYVDADGFHIRYLEAGNGPPVVALHGAGGLSISKAHELLAEQYRVIAFEVPGFGASAVNDRSKSARALANTMAQAAASLGLEKYSLMGTSFGGRLAVWIALDSPDRVDALVLVAPAAVLPEGHVSGGSGTPEQREAAMYAHPERRTEAASPNPVVLQKQAALTARMRDPQEASALKDRLGEIQSPTLVLFGTEDGIIPPEMGRIYRERVPNCNFVLVYDAAHSIASDRPEALASVVGDFLERREVFVVSRETTLINP